MVTWSCTPELVTPLADAVIVVVPGARLVASPVVEILATAELLEFQVKETPGMVAPLDPLAVPTNC